MRHQIFTIATTALLSLCCANCGQSSPVIGITSEGGEAVSRVANSYARAIEMAGGVPVLLPCLNDADAAEKVVKRLDGVLFTGGEDCNPALYGESPHPNLGPVNDYRDACDMAVAKAALKFRKPIMAICRGSQFINVVCGGTLYQDLPSQRNVVHSQTGRVDVPMHDVVVARESALYEAMGQDTLAVNSTHHQAVKDLGEGLKVIATSTDGIVEAYQSTDRKQLILGIQFHPEELAPANDAWYAIFRWFIEKTGKRQ